MSNPYPQMGVTESVAFAWMANAANVKTTSNPSYTEAIFLEDFDQFTGLIPSSLLTQFIGMANATILQVRWHESWRYAMGLFVAHFSTLFLQANGDGVDSNAAKVISAAKARGLQTSKSVGDVSVSYDYSAITQGLSGWGGWVETSYGTTLATIGRMLGKAGMYIY